MTVPLPEPIMPRSTVFSEQESFTNGWATVLGFRSFGPAPVAGGSVGSGAWFMDADADGNNNNNNNNNG